MYKNKTNSISKDFNPKTHIHNKEYGIVVKENVGIKPEIDGIVYIF